MCRSAGLRPEVEKAGLLPGTVYRPADVYLPQYPGGGPAKVALDLAVVSPLQRRYLVDAGIVSHAAAAAYSDAKAERNHCAAACRACGIKFIPLVTDAFGGWAPEAAAAIRDIARAQASRHGLDIAQALDYVHQQLSVTLWRGNVAAVLARLQQPAPPADTLRDTFTARRIAVVCAAAGIGADGADAASCDRPAPPAAHADASGGTGAFERAALEQYFFRWMPRGTELLGVQRCGGSH